MKKRLQSKRSRIKSLLYKINELVYLYNEEHKKELTYYHMHKIISSENHIDFQSKTHEDDCRCETCDNREALKIFLEPLKKHFFKQK